MTDGDRLIYERKTDDWYQDMYHMREYDECGLYMMMIKRRMCQANSKDETTTGVITDVMGIHSKC